MLQNVSRRRIELADRGIALALLDWGGSGPLVILSHANGFCAAMWDEVATALSQSYRVVGFDWRGHGDSDAPPPPDAYVWDEFVADLVALGEALVPELGSGRPAWAIGHSFGGTVSMVAAATRPDLFGRVAMLDPVLIPPEAANLPERAERVNFMADIARKRRHVWPSREDVRASWQTRPPFEHWTPTALDLYLDEGLRDREDGQVELKCSGEVEAAVFGNRSHWNLWEMAERLSVPALLLFAAKGHFVRTVVEELARRAADLRVVDVPAGHLLPMEAPELVAARLLEFGKEG
ncbi:MAG: alpha/beta hydrolase [Deltaproteobacteria bacterium]|nr:alpha/beta hydrolase [Deltaproteobacteria bacterium]MBW2413617.1 alpha/beta hydrolase [Deltaproteobacteria bacterium]